MHQFLVVSMFLTVVIAPCLMAINSGQDELGLYDDEEESC